MDFSLGNLYTGICSAENGRKEGRALLLELYETESSKSPSNIEPASNMSHQVNTSKFSLLFKDLTRQLLCTLMNVTAQSPLWKNQDLTG